MPKHCVLHKYNLCSPHHTSCDPYALHHKLPEALLWPQISQSITKRIWSAKKDTEHLPEKFTSPVFWFS